jgi:hypothetical protein
MEIPPPDDRRLPLLRALLRLLFVTAIVTAPMFLFAEKFESSHVVRVALSHGIVAVGCLVLGRQLAAGNATRVARVLVFGLLALIAALATTNGEPVHVNVVNFVLATVLAGVLLPRRDLVVVGALSAATMVVIAWRGTVAPPGEALLEARGEAIAQFLPTYAVIVAALWLWAGGDTQRRT